MREDQKAGAMLNLNVLYYRSSLIGIIRRDVVSRRGEGTREVVPERHWLVLHLGGFRGLRVRAAFNDSPSWWVWAACTIRELDSCMTREWSLHANIRETTACNLSLMRRCPERSGWQRRERITATTGKWSLSTAVRHVIFTDAVTTVSTAENSGCSLDISSRIYSYDTRSYQIIMSTVFVRNSYALVSSYGFRSVLEFIVV